MNNLECDKCGKIAPPKIILNFSKEDIEKAKQGSQDPVQFHIQADCRMCGKFIKFLSHKEWLPVIHKKEIAL